MLMHLEVVGRDLKQFLTKTTLPINIGAKLQILQEKITKLVDFNSI